MARAFIAAMLRPHDGKDAELGVVGLAAENALTIFWYSSGVSPWLTTSSGVTAGCANGAACLQPCASHPVRRRPPRSEEKIFMPSSLPRSLLQASSGWGIRPKTLRSSIADAGDIIQRAIGIGRRRRFAL